MKNSALVLVGTALLFFVSAPMLQAQGTINGCVNSPENPTAVLALVGSAGAFFSSRSRFRIK